MTDELERLPSRDQFNRMFWLPCAQAAIAISRGNFDHAIALLEPLRRYDLGSVFGYQSLYLRGLAYLGKRDPAAASREFQAIIDHRGVSPWSPNWALARLGLARARSFQGDTAGARSAYEQLLILWKDGDPALPIRRQVQQEYSKLSGPQP
jgi:tetratricopeptide (TPR) repeat protein